LFPPLPTYTNPTRKRFTYSHTHDETMWFTAVSGVATTTTRLQQTLGLRAQEMKKGRLPQPAKYCITSDLAFCEEEK